MPPGTAMPGAVDLAVGWLRTGAFAAGVLALAVCGIVLLAGRRHSRLVHHGVGSGAWVLVGLVLAALAGTIAAVVAGVAG